MAPTARRKADIEPSLEEQFRQHLMFKVQGAELTAEAEKLKKKFKEMLGKVWDEENQNGSRFKWLTDTIEVAGRKYKGMELRKNEGRSYFDEEAAEKLLTDKGIPQKEWTTPTIDQDKVLALHQRGKLTDQELDSLYPTPDATWAFWPVTGTVD